MPVRELVLGIWTKRQNTAKSFCFLATSCLPERFGLLEGSDTLISLVAQLEWKGGPVQPG